MECNAEGRFQHARGLEHQGKLHHATDGKADICSTRTTTTAAEVLSTRHAAPQFQPCSVEEERWPFNCLQAVWRNANAAPCPQPLRPTALDLRHFNVRHDAVLEVIEQAWSRTIGFTGGSFTHPNSF